MAAEPQAVPVRLADGADSGLASIVQQYLEQDLAEFAQEDPNLPVFGGCFF